MEEMETAYACRLYNKLTDGANFHYRAYDWFLHHKRKSDVRDRSTENYIREYEVVTDV